MLFFLTGASPEHFQKSKFKLAVFENGGIVLK